MPAGRKVLALSGQIWRRLVALLLVAVLLWKEPEVAWKEATGYSENKACSVGDSDSPACSVCSHSPGRRGDGKRWWRTDAACGEFGKLQGVRAAADSWRSTSVAHVWLLTNRAAWRQSEVHYMLAMLATMISGLRGGHSDRCFVSVLSTSMAEALQGDSGRSFASSQCQVVCPRRWEGGRQWNHADGGEVHGVDCFSFSVSRVLYVKFQDCFSCLVFHGPDCKLYPPPMY